jgi:hypothetical protein
MENTFAKTIEKVFAKGHPQVLEPAKQAASETFLFALLLFCY